jgi:phosphoglycolate phosphatase
MKTTHFRASAVAIDLDGTLIDTEAEICSAVNQVLAYCGRAALSSTVIVSLTGRGSHILIESALRISQPITQPIFKFSADQKSLLDLAVKHFKAVYQGLLGTQSQVYSSVRDGLELLQAQAFRMVCVTNKGLADANFLLKHFELAHFFEAVLAPQTLAERKPAPFLLNKAAGLMGLQPAQLVLIGDSNNDVLAARAVGASVIRLATGYERHKLDKIAADLNCQTFLQAAQAISWNQTSTYFAT